MFKVHSFLMEHTWVFVIINVKMLFVSEAISMKLGLNYFVRKRPYYLLFFNYATNEPFSLYMFWTRGRGPMRGRNVAI